MLKAAKVVGINTDQWAAQTLVRIGADGSSVKTPHFNLFVIVSCRLDDAFSRTRQALLAAEDTFYTSSQPLSAKVSDVLEVIQKSLADGEDLQIALAATEDEGALDSDEPSGTKALYLLCLGSAISAYLYRDGKVANLSNGDGQMISGFLKAGDRVVMLTESMERLLGESFANTGKIPIDSFEEELSLMLPQEPTESLAMVAIEEEVEAAEIRPFEEKEILGESLLAKESIDLGKVGRELGSAVFKAIPRSKRAVAVLGIVLLLAILGGAGALYLHKKNFQTQAKFSGILSKASADYTQASSLKESDPAAAATHLASAKNELAEALKIRLQDVQALELKKQITDNSGDILRAFTVSDFPIWLDLNLIKKGFNADKLSLSHGKLLALDQNQKALVEIDLRSKAPKVLAGQEKLGDAQFAALNGGMAWVYSSDQGVVGVDTGNNDIKTAIKLDKEWGNIGDIYGFSGNVYLLDSSKNQIWKYLPIASGYSDKRAYLDSDTKADFTDAKRMQIDSSVWVLKSNGDILKYTQGAADFFSFSGLDTPVNDSKSFFVSDQTDNLYLLDSGNNRLLVLDKKGAYKAQYKSDKFQGFSDLVVDEQDKKVYLLSGSKISQMELK